MEEILLPGEEGGMGIWEGAQRFLGKRRRTSHRQQNIKGGTIKSNFHSTASEWGS